MDWFLDQWSKHPAATTTIVAAVIADVIGIGVAVVNAWATLRAGKRNGDPAPTNQNNQTGQQGGQGVQAHTIHGGVHHNDGSSFDANQLARDYADASRRLGALEAENEQLREQVNQGDAQTEAAVAQAVADASVVLRVRDGVPGAGDLSGVVGDVAASHLPVHPREVCVAIGGDLAAHRLGRGGSEGVVEAE